MTTRASSPPRPESGPSAYSLLDPAVIESPWAYYRLLHEETPVWNDPHTGFYIVSSYALIQAALRDEAQFSAAVDRPRLRPGGLPEEVRTLMARRPLTPTLIGCDSPHHDLYRPLVNMVFSSARVEALEPGIAAIVDGLIDEFADAGACEAISAFAAPLPLSVIADQLGVPRAMLAQFKLWSDAIVQLLGLVGDDARLIECAHAQQACLDFLLEQAALRRTDPQDTILSDLANARIEGGRLLNDAELASILVQLLVAGNETTTNTIGSGLLALARAPALQDEVRAADARGMRLFVEEILRSESAVQGHYRRAKVDVELGGVTIPAGSVVHLRYGAGNRDERQFPDAARIDIARANAPQHLAFGGGAHFCVGAMLARKELFVAFRRILDRVEKIALAPGAVLERFPSMQHRGLRSLPLTFRARTMA
jgi:cytochrome P450